MNLNWVYLRQSLLLYWERVKEVPADEPEVEVHGWLRGYRVLHRRLPFLPRTSPPNSQSESSTNLALNPKKSCLKKSEFKYQSTFENPFMLV
jgi:hypothetical protein